VKANREEYHSLPDTEKERLMNEYAKVKECKAIGVRVSSHSKINDVAHTFACVENEVHVLRCY
jgi:hypothetical protein